MLDALKSEAEGEGENEKYVHDKHMRHCENAGDTLAESIADAEDDSPQEGVSEDLGDTTAAEKAAIAPHTITTLKSWTSLLWPCAARRLRISSTRARKMPKGEYW